MSWGYTTGLEIAESVPPLGGGFVFQILVDGEKRQFIGLDVG
jgi:hypothetical protein